MEQKKKSEIISNKILEYVTEYLSEYGYSPSMRDIASAVGIKSVSTVHYYVEKLKNNGLLNKTSQQNRSISLDNRANNDNACIPLIGVVTAGNPILAEENIEEYFSISKSLFTEGSYMLNVKGNSMINAKIFDGDKIVVKKQEYANIGDIVVAIVDDDYATVKRYTIKKDMVILKAENPDYSDIVSNNVKIAGKVIGVLRQI